MLSVTNGSSLHAVGIYTHIHLPDVAQMNPVGFRRVRTNNNNVVDAATGAQRLTLTVHKSERSPNPDWLTMRRVTMKSGYNGLSTNLGLRKRSLKIV